MVVDVNALLLGNNVLLLEEAGAIYEAHPVGVAWVGGVYVEEKFFRFHVNNLERGGFFNEGFLFWFCFLVFLLLLWLFLVASFVVVFVVDGVFVGGVFFALMFLLRCSSVFVDVFLLLVDFCAISQERFHGNGRL